MHTHRSTEKACAIRLPHNFHQFPLHIMFEIQPMLDSL